MRILLMLCCLSLSVFLWADPWGAFSDYDSPSVSAGNGGTSSSYGVGDRYLLRPVLEGRTVKVRLVGEEEPEEMLALWREKIQEAYNEWFFNTAKHIRNAKRESEFADILPLLDRGIPVEFVEEGEDITVEFVDRREVGNLCKDEDAAACYVFAGPTIYVPKNPRRRKDASILFRTSSGKLMFAYLVHEIGHSLGFSDQYIIARDKDTHSIYRGENPDNTIMNSRNLSLTCDDADGIVNLIDITRQNHRGGNDGWPSLCKKSTAYYVNGMQLGVGPYEISLENNNVWNVRTYQNGTLTEEQSFAPQKDNSLSPFVSFSEKVLRRDKLNRPLLAQGSNGEKIYYMYSYDSSLRLVTKDENNLLAEKREKLASRGRSLTRRFVWFYTNRREAFLYAVKFGSQGKAFYSEGKNGEFVSLEMRFNKKRRLESWSGTEVENADTLHLRGPVRAQTAAQSSGLSGKLTKQVEKKLDSAEKQQLVEKVEWWYYNK